VLINARLEALALVDIPAQRYLDVHCTTFFWASVVGGDINPWYQQSISGNGHFSCRLRTLRIATFSLSTPISRCQAPIEKMQT
jgi:hypothetical protein